MNQVDLNCDLGESFGAYKIGLDEEILEFVTSANIACGFHAGDPGVMRKTVKMAAEKGVKIGAHPGLPDLAGFGRRNMAITPEEAYDLVVYQIGALSGFLKAEGVTMQHVKPHGALYNMAAQSRELSDAIARAVYQTDPELILFGLAGSELVLAGERAGLKTAHEVFADRTYQEDGTLTSRRQNDALIQDDDEAVGQVIRMVKEGKVRSLQGTDVILKADTVCIHGDGAHALHFAKKIRRELRAADIKVQAFST
ncbi:lactam utilization protein LamB [Bacillus licheniformis]|uniref:5-oxoprolinase subunit PxpA n=1 Tax=Bacillus licheniformis TaxID=1402 RepID=UPI00077E0FFB|nr:5-oxoprolinase subunit PxpA [Bacillus licheniformis]MDP4166749.1 5-oxoprolinase subunit PxpA [Bacillota bacterium]AMR09111.1 lactam utilization protein LamB [Bacillus licheniformis]MEC1859182.1 5-oxoprolinase subunit PxpA [Bacillus licheniformis]PAE38927.1 lactam utilization protein LamB [Bacillus licheniformis]WIW99187.1 5-oxoprolinase subunit PxpA [Bacillus licheniformis]